MYVCVYVCMMYVFHYLVVITCKPLPVVFHNSNVVTSISGLSLVIDDRTNVINLLYDKH